MKSNQKRAGNLGSASYRLLSMFLAFVIVVAGAIAMSQTAAHAATGTITNPAIAITQDGVSGVDGDTGPNDGKVGVVGTVAFSWSLTVNELADGVVSQTLPAGWTWNTASLNTSGMHNPNGLNGYTSTYEVSPDGRTVTLHISTSAGSTSTQIIEFNSPTATAGYGAERYSPYTPELQITDGAGTRVVAPTGEPSHVEVVAEASLDLRKGARTGNVGALETYDFGNGPEPAVRHTFYVELWRNQGIGNDLFQWKGPMRVADSFTLTHDGQNAMGSGQAITLGGNSGSGLVVSLANVNAGAGTFEVVFDSIPDSQSVWTDVNIWIPKSNVPNVSAQGTFPIVMVNTAAKPAGATWETSTGVPLVDTVPGNNQSVGNYGVVDPLPGAIGEEMTHDLTNLAETTSVNGWGTLPGAEYRGRLTYFPVLDRPVGATVWSARPVTNLNLIDRWNPTDATLLPDEGYVNSWLPDGTMVRNVEGVDYRVYYTTDDPVTVSSPTWVLRGAYSGDIAAVSGIRYEYIGNGGVFQPQAADVDRSLFGWVARPAFVVKRGLPDPAVPTDLGRIVHFGSATSSSAALLGPVGRDLFVRSGGAAITKKGVALDAAGEVVTPETPYLAAGDSVRYTIDPTLTGLNAQLTPTGGIPAGLTVKNVVVVDCLPTNLRLDTITFRGDTLAKWDYSVGSVPCNGGAQQLRFTYKGEATYADDLSNIEFDVTTSSVAPQGSGFYNWVSVAGTGINNASNQYAADAGVWMYASQLNVAQHEKSSLTPIIERGDVAKYEVQWLNFLSSSRQKSVFVDVLPYDGDPRGTKVNGPVSLKSATLTATSRVGATLELTTDPAVRDHSDAPADGVAWVSYDSATTDQIAAATALRVVLSDFVAGADSVGSLVYELEAPEANNGDVLKNTVTGSLMNGANFLKASAPATVTVQASALAGRVWNDADGSQAVNGGEAGIPNVKVALYSGTNKLTETTSDSTGAYSFRGLRSGDYSVRVDESTLPATAGAWTNTTAPAGGSGGVSGTISVTAGTDVAAQDFGYRNNLPGITLVKTGAAPTKIAAGEDVRWTFTVTNSGNVPLKGVDIQDARPGLSDVAFGTWPQVGEPGTLYPGQKVSAEATSELTQDEIDLGKAVNTATAVGTSDVPALTVGNTVTAEVPLAASDGILLEKSAAVLRQGAATAQADAKAGDTASYTFTVTNTGNRTLSDVNVIDELPGLSDIMFGDWPAADGVLKPGDSVTATASVVLTQAHIDAGLLVNTATATGKAPDGADLEDEDEATLAFGNTAAIDLTKSATMSDGVPQAGQAVTYQFVVTNTGNRTLGDVEIVDELPGLSEIVFGEWPAGDGTLKPGESVTATASVALTQAHIDAGLLTNTATVTSTGLGSPLTERVTDTASASVKLAQSSQLQLVKTAALSKDGSVVKYQFVIKNSGNTTLSGVTITDKLPGLSQITYTWPGTPGALAPGESATAVAELGVTTAMFGSTVVNVAVAEGVAPGGPVASEESVASVVIPRPHVSLPTTGINSMLNAGLLAILVIGGGSLLLIRRRRVRVTR